MSHDIKDATVKCTFNKTRNHWESHAIVTEESGAMFISDSYGVDAHDAVRAVMKEIEHVRSNHLRSRDGARLAAFELIGNFAKLHRMASETGDRALMKQADDARWAIMEALGHKRKP